VDSAGETIEFMLSPKRDLSAAKLFLGLALSASRGIRPRVINVDGHPAYASDLPPWRTVYLLSFSETRFERSAVGRPGFSIQHRRLCVGDHCIPQHLSIPEFALNGSSLFCRPD